MLHFCLSASASYSLFLFTELATTEISTLSLHDALPISSSSPMRRKPASRPTSPRRAFATPARSSFSPSPPSRWAYPRSEEHTSELQSHSDLVCRLLLEKKKQEN